MPDQTSNSFITSSEDAHHTTNPDLKSRIIIVVMILIMIIAVLTSFMYGRNTASSPTSLPTFVSILLTHKWDTFQNTDYGYSVKYPSHLMIYGDIEYRGDIQFGDYIEITVNEKNMPCADCITEKIISSEPLTLNGMQGKRIVGQIVPDEAKDMYYEPPQKFVRAEFDRGETVFQMTVYELSSDAYAEYNAKRKYPENRKLKDIPYNEMQLFENMLATLKFFKPSLKFGGNTGAFVEPSVTSYPSPYPEFWQEENFSPSITPALTTQQLILRDSQRKNEITSILNAIYSYKADHNNTITGLEMKLSSTPKTISSPNFTVFCEELVPAYIDSLPVDRLIRNDVAITVSDCKSANTWTTEYTVQLLADGKIQLSAPLAELPDPVTVSR